MMNNVNFARMALIILVVLGHSLAPWTGDWGYTEAVIDAPILGYISLWIGTYHTMALTAISGFTYEYIVDRRGGYLFKSLIKKKISRLLIPYLAVATLWIIPLTSYFTDITPDFVVTKYILGKSPSQLWFLLMLFDVFVLFYPLRLILNKSKLFYLVIFIIFIFGYIHDDPADNYFQFFTALKYLSFFTLGHLVYRHRGRLFAEKKISFHNPLVLALLVFIHVFLYVVYLQDIPKTKTVLMLLLNFGGCLMAMVVLFRIGDRINQQSRWFKLINENSFAVYLFHQQIIYYTLFFLNGMICPIFHATINFIISLSLSLVVTFAIRKIRFLRIYMLGNKQ